MSKLGFYPVQDKYGQHRLPGVTTILDYTLGFPSNFADWAVKEGTTKLLQELRKAKKENRRILKPEAIEIALSGRQDILKQAQKKGLYVHDAAEGLFQGVIPDLNQATEFKEEVASLMAWYSEQDIEPIFQEQFVYDMDEDYAGRLDLYCKYFGEEALIDYKTTRNQKPEHGIQLVAYKNALIKMGFPVKRMFVLYITPIGCQLVEHFETFDLFQAVNKVFKWKIQQNSAYDEWYSRMPEEEVKKQLKRLNAHVI